MPHAAPSASSFPALLQAAYESQTLHDEHVQVQLQAALPHLPLRQIPRSAKQVLLYLRSTVDNFGQVSPGHLRSSRAVWSSRGQGPTQRHAGLQESSQSKLFSLGLRVTGLRTLGAWHACEGVVLSSVPSFHSFSLFVYLRVGRTNRAPICWVPARMPASDGAESQEHSPVSGWGWQAAL